jgi:hypothetical protein
MDDHFGEWYEDWANRRVAIVEREKEELRAQ